MRGGFPRAGSPSGRCRRGPRGSAESGRPSVPVVRVRRRLPATLIRMGPELFFVVVGAVIVAAFARWRGIPAPLLVTVVALAASFLPLFQDLAFDGHLLLTLVLPPLLYSAALDVSFVSFRRSMPQIQRLGVGLVLVTTVAVGLVAWWLMPDLTLPGALLLGAIVAPPDAVSAAAIGRKLGLPRRVMTVLSGESLINDATSLTLYRVFAAIVAGAALTVWDGIWQFVLAVVIGVGVGLLFGVLVHQLRMRISDAVVIGSAGLIVPFGAYGIAEHLGGSGVLAVVAMGLFIGYQAPRTGYTTRLQERPLWLSADFLLESFVFAYIGLQFPRVLSDLGAESVGAVLGLAGAVLLVVLLVRPLFVYPSSWWGAWRQSHRVRRWERARERRPERGRPPEGGRTGRRQGRKRPRTDEELRELVLDPRLSWQENAVISWAGMRGVVTLATALAVADLTGLDQTASHAIVVVAFIVTVGTLLLQGLTLPWLISRLGVAASAGPREREQDERQLAMLRVRTREAGKVYLAEQREQWVAARGPASLEAFDTLARTLKRVEAETAAEQKAEEAAEGLARPTYDDLVALSKGWLGVRREVLLAEREAGALSEEVMRDMLAALDAEELALDTRGALRRRDEE